MSAAIAINRGPVAWEAEAVATVGVGGYSCKSLQRRGVEVEKARDAQDDSRTENGGQYVGVGYECIIFLHGSNLMTLIEKDDLLATYRVLGLT